MLTVEKSRVMNIDGAIRGARNPMNSWDRSDSFTDSDGNFVLGQEDLNLGQRLCAAGADHRKFLRQIFVSADISAPLYWWKEFDTYKVGTVSNSCSTMHKIHSKPFGRSDFSCERMDEAGLSALDSVIDFLECQRIKFNETKDRVFWHNIIQLLPTGYNQLRTITMNYENLVNIYAARKNHKLHEWHVLCRWIEQLPYSEEFIQIKKIKS